MKTFVFVWLTTFCVVSCGAPQPPAVPSIEEAAATEALETARVAVRECRLLHSFVAGTLRQCPSDDASTWQICEMSELEIAEVQEACVEARTLVYGLGDPDSWLWKRLERPFAWLRRNGAFDDPSGG